MSGTQKIPLIDVQAQNRPLQEELLSAVRSVLESGAFILGPEVKALEDEIQAYTRVPHAIGCASGSDALLLPLMAAGVGPGDEVLVPSFTFYATVGAVARLGATPVFVDSDETYNISLADMEKKITSRTKAMIPVHLYGQLVDMEAVLKLARARGNLLVIEDCAQSIGAEFKGRQAGAWGDYGAFSFYPTKNLGAMGDAGLITALDNGKAEAIRMIRVHGSKQRYYHELVGVNSRLDSLQAAMLRVKLRHLREYEAGRERVAQAYQRLFAEAGLEEVRLPVVGGDRKHVWNQFTIRARKRDELRAYLGEQGIGSEIYYPLAMHKQAAFRPFLKGEVRLPVCEVLEQEVLSLPMYPELKGEQIERVVQAIRAFYRRR